MSCLYLLYLPVWRWLYLSRIISRQILLLADKAFRKIVCGISFFIHVNQTPLCCTCNWVQFWFWCRTWTIIENYTPSLHFWCEELKLPRGFKLRTLALQQFVLNSRRCEIRNRRRPIYLLGTSNFRHANR